MYNNQKDQMNHAYFLRAQYFIPINHMCIEDICWLCLVQGYWYNKFLWKTVFVNHETTAKT